MYNGPKERKMENELRWEQQEWDYENMRVR